MSSKIQSHTKSLRICVPLYHSPAVLSFQQIGCLPRVELCWNYDRSIAASPIRFAVGLDQESLFFAAEFLQPIVQFENVQRGQFYEGLWERDVAEIFITSEGQKIYQEFNLAPSGAWWSMRFDAPRQRMKVNLQFDQVSSRVNITSNSCLASAKFPLSIIAPEISNASKVVESPEILSKLRLNVCACLGATSRTFLSFAHLPGSQPDFHQPGSFSQIMLISVN